MVEFLSSLLNFIGRDQALVKIIATLLILVFGHLLVKATQMGARKFWITNKEEITKKQMVKRQDVLKYLGLFGDAAVLTVSLVYLNTSITQQLFSEISSFLPKLVSAALVAVLGIIAIRLVTKIGKNFLQSTGVQSYFKDVGLSRNAVELIAGFFKAFLYLILLQLSLDIIGIGDSFVRELITASSWAAAFMVAALVFYGFKDLFQNFAAGVYLQNSRFVRPGEEVNIDGNRAEIRDVSLFSTSLDTNRGDIVLTPNVNVMNSELAIKRTKSDIDTLEDIKNYFVAEKPEYAGIAPLEMVLEIFGYRYTQEEIWEKMEDMEEDEESGKIISALEELTNEEVRAAFVEEEKITDLSAEFKTWFNDGALVLPNFKKSKLFPEAEESHYVLSVSVEGNEILLVDPSSRDGGVYYSDKDRLKDAMESLETEKGYIVVAPKSTTAYWRIKNDLLYSDKNYYDELSKTLEARLRKIMRQGRLLKEATPSTVDSYLEKWRTDEEVTRLWAPDEDDTNQTPEDN